jgi:soluble lytic murein transglycosylase
LYRVFYTMPTSDEAEAANAELQKLAKDGPIPPPSTSLRKTRADLLLQNRRASDAVPEYEALVQQASSSELRPLQMSLAVALYRSGRDREADDLLMRMGDQPDEINAQRLFYQLEIARPDQHKVAELLSVLRTTAEDSPWFQEALLSAANTYLLEKDFDTASRLYAELSDNFPEGKYGPYATWKTAWLELRSGRQAEARDALERYIDLYPHGSELGAALYWRGRIAEDEKNLSIARAYYSKIDELFYNSYYGSLARQRLQQIDVSGEKASEILLSKISAKEPNTNIALTPPADDLRVQKSKLLENGALADFAVRELQTSAGSGSSWLATETARIYSESGKYHRALQTVKRAVPGYYSLQLDELPRPVWEYLFPKAYWQDLRRYASSNGLDPFLIASLIRQESEFNAAALSRANAMGLMQILPGTGKKLAKQLKIRGFDNSLLLDPTYNLQLGTRYFRDLLKRYDGQIEYALAAYNAGPERVDEWKKGSYRDMPEFVESIPFTETREYVQAIVRNVGLYQRLYSNP